MLDQVNANKPVTRDGWWLIAVVSPLLLLGGWMLWPDPPRSSNDWPSPGIEAGQARETVASQWQVPPNPVSLNETVASGPEPRDHSNTESDSPEISLDRLQHALANIAVDQEGNLVLDEVALASLQQAFRAVKNLDAATIDELQLYVRAGLAGETGDQAARILGDYVRYRHSLAEAEAAWARNDSLSPRQKLERTIALRREYMDPVTTSQLFAGEDAHQRYLMAMEDIRSNTELSEQQRKEATARVRKDLRSGRLLVDGSDSRLNHNLRQQAEQWKKAGVPEETRRYLEHQSLGLAAARDLAGSDPEDWGRRYRQFEREREAILRAGLTVEEKQRQVRQLETTYFTEEERNAAESWLPHHLRLEAGR